MKQIPLTHGKFALVDDDDFDRLMKWKWHYSNTGCAQRTKNSRKILMHRDILNTPDGLETDHIDADRLNNQKLNLRVATKSQNNMNRSSHNGSSSQYKGVARHPKSNKWIAQIQINYKQIYIGIYESEIAAAKAYNAEAIKYFGEFARINGCMDRPEPSPGS